MFLDGICTRQEPNRLRVMGNISLLTCATCSSEFSPDPCRTHCVCGAPLTAKYDLLAIRRRWNRDDLAREPQTLWRYHAVLPAELGSEVSLGEGWTPLSNMAKLGKSLGVTDVWIKDESRNPTGSCRDRDASMVITVARSMGFAKLAAATGGDGGSALAAYAARAGLEAQLFLPADVPQSSFLECQSYGTQVKLNRGPIPAGVLDVSAFESIRLEGQKTAGYELAEQLAWEAPDAIVCPCGDGLALAAIYKAFGELQELGWTGAKTPKMIAVQAAGCAPIVEAFESNAENCVRWPNPHALSVEMRDPQPALGFLALRAVRQTGGTALAVTDEEMLDETLLLAKLEGLFAAPETGACVAAVRRLVTTGLLRSTERIVLYNVASGFRRTESFATRFTRRMANEQDKLGGLILPR
jgi:threonine synthase